MKCDKCHTVQLKILANLNLIYNNYWYRSGTNNTMINHLNNIAEDIRSRLTITTTPIIIDIGCNDGTLLQAFPDMYKIGIDPSNIIPIGCDVFINDYFSYKKIPIKATVITSIAMFYDLTDPKSFIKDIQKCLDYNGIWIVELAYLPDILKDGAYDTICHEHIIYYSLTTFEKLLEGTNLQIFDVSFNKMNGGSMRLFICH